METDAGLVQDVKDAAQARAHLGGEPNALSLSTGQGSSGAVQGQVVEPDVDQEAQPLG